MERHFETLIAGAGCAGMNCALELKKGGREYVLVSPNIGGRVFNDEVRHMNYGAVFYFGTYKHMLASGLLKGTSDVLPKLSMGQCHHDDGKSYEPISGTTLKDLPSILSYMKWMRKEFIPRYSKFKDDCCVMEVSEALEKDPLIKELYAESAEHFIKRMGFEPICRDLVSMFAHACTGTRIKDLTALDYLNTVQPLTMQIPPLKLLYDLKRFDFDSAAVKKQLSEGSGEVLIGEIVHVERTADGMWRVKIGPASEQELEGRVAEVAQAGWVADSSEPIEITCDNLVMATPAHITARLLEDVSCVPDLDIRKASQLTGYLLRGKIRPDYADHMLHLFDDTIPIIYIARRFDGDYEIFTEVDFEKTRKFDEYFTEWEVVGKKHWPYALYTAAHEVLPQNLAPGLIMAGDVNGLGMEPAAISGIYAANKIMGAAR